ncbi:hypothetical protein QMT40_001777 [Parvibaculaceae bacterium PLY_AMNH_Bact1]|nr:hypothetical protein QMT40_001777 [Parvibaculaceae bacterium PLY_AMNH_Bact1]
MPWGAAIGAAASIGGGLLSSKGNKKAAAEAAQAQIRAAEIQAQATREQIAELKRQYDESNRRLDEARESGQEYLGEAGEEADQRYEAISAGAAPATSYLRTIIADPGRLTAVQKEGLEEARRGANNQIRGSSFAGSGRTAAAMLRSVDADYINTALEANKSRAAGAAGGLSDVYYNAEGARAQNRYDRGKSAANIELGVGTSQATNATNLGNQVGNALSNQGYFAANAANQAGQYHANATAANANIAGGVIGDLGGIIASEARKSRYGSGDNIFKKNGV